MVTQGYTATLVAATLAISRSSRYYRNRPHGSRADRTYDEQIVMACGEKLCVRLSASGVVALAKERTACESQAGVTGDAGTWVAGARASFARTKEKRVGPGGSSQAESNLADGNDQDLGECRSWLGLSGMRLRSSSVICLL
jgi:hypothetical protein